MKPGFVYLAKVKGHPYVKIGFSTNPKYRERTLQAQQPDLEFFEVFPGCRGIEGQLQAEYAHKRVRGEWFDLSEIDLECLREIADRHRKEGV